VNAPRPLEGRRIAVTRHGTGAAELARAINSLGGEAVVYPAIAIVPTETPVSLELSRYDWVIFTSANAASFFPLRSMPPLKVAAIGHATARAVTEAWRVPDVVGESQTADSFAAQLGEVAGQRVLFPKGELARDALPESLRRRGATVDEIVVYRTVPGEGVAALCDALDTESLDAILFASPSAITFTLDALAARRSDPFRRAAPPAIFCIGPSTAAALRARGLEPAAVAEAFTNEGLIDALTRWFADRSRGLD
jgi:uroporphyrinogen-III synthase